GAAPACVHTGAAKTKAAAMAVPLSTLFIAYSSRVGMGFAKGRDAEICGSPASPSELQGGEMTPYSHFIIELAIFGRQAHSQSLLVANLRRARSSYKGCFDPVHCWRLEVTAW